MRLQPDDTVLFLGDSITDCGHRDAANNGEGLGRGYAALVAARLNARYPEWNLRFINHGISGHRVYDLEKRLSEPGIAEVRPTFVSILIGVNDTWRRYDSNLPSPIEDFRAALHRVLKTVAERGVSRILLLEPFLLPVPEERRAWRADLDPRIQVVRDCAVEAGAAFVALDGRFAEAAARRPAAFWLPDGVHPSAAGHALIADAWLERVCG